VVVVVVVVGAIVVVVVVVVIPLQAKQLAYTVADISSIKDGGVPI
jgi:hypothetical protein